MNAPTDNVSGAEDLNDKIYKALKTFKLNQHHEKIYDNPNDLIDAGFPSALLLPLIRVFQSTEGYKYYCRELIVDELIGISHASLVYAIAKCLEVPSDTGTGLTGRGFVMQSYIEAIRKKLASPNQTL